VNCGAHRGTPPRFDSRVVANPSRTSGHIGDRLEGTIQIERGEIDRPQYRLQLRSELKTQCGSSSLGDVDRIVPRDGELAPDEIHEPSIGGSKVQTSHGVVDVLEIADGYVATRQGGAKLLPERLSRGGADYSTCGGGIGR